MKEVVCLYDMSGLAARDWANAGYVVHCYDLLNQDTVEFIGDGRIEFHSWDATAPEALTKLIDRHKDHCVFLMGFPPCTDLAVSGAAHFASKAAKNPDFQKEAAQLAYLARDLGEALGVPYFIENPISVLSTLWRKPNYIFHPWEYGGYLPTDDVHPMWPEYIAPRDAYPKRTCYWSGGGFTMPPKKRVFPGPGYSTQHKKLGGKSAKTKEIRSLSPRGIAKAIFLHREDYLENGKKGDE